MLSTIEQFNNLSVVQKAALVLLRHALYDHLELNLENLDTTILASLTSYEWDEVHLFASKQGFSAIAFESLKSLSEYSSIPKKLKIKWAIEAETAKRKFEYFCQQSIDFEKFLYKIHLVPVHMKGLSLSLLYPHPELREFGDFDIYSISAETDFKMHDICDNSMKVEAFAAANGMVVDTAYPKHGTFYFNGIHVESHRFLLNTHRLKASLPIENKLMDNLYPETSTLPDGRHIHTCKPEFTKSFVAFHSLQHCGSGLRIRHIIDWAMICRAYGDDLSNFKYSKVLYNGASSLSALSNIILGTDFKTLDNPIQSSLMFNAIINSNDYEIKSFHGSLVKSFPSSMKKYIYRHHLSKCLFPETPNLLFSLFRTASYKLKRLWTNY